MSHNQYQREMAMVLDAQPPIFKLDVDCFEELFDWLSLKDLHAFGQTCKRMQQVAGYFFRLTHPEVFVRFLEDKLLCNGVNISGFGEFIENIKFEYFGRFVADSYEFKSLKNIRFRYIRFNGANVACIKKHLCKVEIIEISGCVFNVDFYNEFLKHCTNLKRLVCHEIAHLEYNWLLQHYPSLEQLVLDPAEYTKIDELTTFFERNPSVRYFAANPELLWANRHSFTASNVKLDTLSLIVYYRDVTDKFRGMMNKFRKREVYKRLNLNVDDDLQDALLKFAPACAIEKLTYDTLPTYITSLRFVNLKEFYSRYIPNDLDMEIVVNAFVNIEHIWFEEVNATQIVAFIGRSRKLTKIAIKNIREEESNVLQLASWNKEREKLAGAQKVTIYVPEEVFLGTKEATQNRDYQFIDIKRIDSLCWTDDFRFFNHY